MLEEQISSEMTSQDVLELLTSSHEYEELPVRHNEDSVNSELAQQLPVPVRNTNYDLPSTKAHLLLHAHFSRISRFRPLITSPTSKLSSTKQSESFR